MQEGVSEHGADAQADEGRHELFVEGLAETGDHDDADEGEKGDDGRGEETVAVDLRERRRILGRRRRVRVARGCQRLLQESRTDSADSIEEKLVANGFGLDKADIS